MILPLGTGGMLELVGTQLNDISLKQYMPEQTQFHGIVTSVAGTIDKLFIMVREETTATDGNYHILQGVLHEEDYSWNHLSTIAYVGTPTNAEYHTALSAVGIFSGTTVYYRLLIGIEDTNGDVPYYIPLDPTDTNWGYTNTTSANAITAVFDAGFPHQQKTFLSVDGEGRNLGAAGRLFTIDYRTSRYAAWTLLGTFNPTDNEDTLAFQGGTTGLTLELRFTPAATAITTTPSELVRFRVTYALRNAPIESIPLRIYLADNQELLNGTTESRANRALSQLRTWDAQAAEVNVIVSEGLTTATSRDMVFVPGTLKIRQIGHEAGRRSEWLVEVLLVEV